MKKTSNSNATTCTMENLYDFNSKNYLATFRAHPEIDYKKNVLGGP